MKKINVSSQAEALDLITKGMNPMLLVSPEAPFGFRKDGTPAAQRGRKALAAEVKAAKVARKAASGRKVREKTGPLVKTTEAPFGVKLDGSAMQKRGRPSREVSAAKMSAKLEMMEAQRLLRHATKSVKKADNMAKKEARARNAALIPVDQIQGLAPVSTEAAIAEVTSLLPKLTVAELMTAAPEMSVSEVILQSQEALVAPPLVARPQALENILITSGTRVQLISDAVVGEQSSARQGVVTLIRGNGDNQKAFVKWDDQSTDFRYVKVLEPIEAAPVEAN